MSRLFLIMAASAALTLALFAPRPALAGLRLCNQSSERIAASVASYIDAVFDTWWESEGWWTMQPGECATPLKADLDARYYYVYGDGTAHVWKGTYNFCLDPEKKFTFTDADTKCPNGVWKGFRRIDTGNYKQFTYTFYD